MQDQSTVSPNSGSRTWRQILKNPANGMPDGYHVTSCLASHWWGFSGFCVTSWILNLVKPDSDHRECTQILMVQVVTYGHCPATVTHFSQCSKSLLWWKFLILYPNRKRAAGPISGVPHLGTVANDIQRQTAYGMRDNQHQPCDARAGLAGSDGRLCMLCCLLCQGQRACQDSTAPWEIKAMWWPNLTSRCKAEKWLSRTNRQSQNTLPLRFRWQFVCMIISRKWKSITQIQSIDSFQSKNSILHSK